MSEPVTTPAPVIEMKKERSRFAFLVNGAYQVANERSTPILHPYTKHFSTGEIAWERPSCTLDKEWVPINQGWIETPSFVVIINKGFCDIEVCPADDSKDPADWIPFMVIPVNFPQVFHPTNLKTVRLRAADGGKGLYKLIVVPG